MAQVTVVGGGLSGSEAAYQLAERGHDVALLEMRPVRGTAAPTQETAIHHPSGDIKKISRDNNAATNGLSSGWGSDHWRVFWFSPRCFLSDISRFRRLAPYLRPRTLPELAARKLLSRGYPPSLEVMVHQSYTKPRKMHRVDLMSDKAFTLHPATKDERFNRLLPGILDSIASGIVPESQRGGENVDLGAWEAHLSRRDPS